MRELYNLLGLSSETEKVNHIITKGAAARLTDKEFLVIQISNWKESPRRKEQITGEKYYQGQHDILKQKRLAIGNDGNLQEVKNLPNSKLIDNQYAKMVDQKQNYLLGKPVTLQTENKVYAMALAFIFNARFFRTFRNLGEDSLNGGIGWLMPYYSDAGELQFRRFEPYEILPFWADAEHTILDGAIRLYEIETYEGNRKQVVESVEFFAPDGIYRYTLDGYALKEDAEKPYTPYAFAIDNDGGEFPLNWTKIPFIPWKCNSKEIPLIRRTKSLQDGINLIMSAFENNMLEDPRNTILVIVNYDGENLGEFRKNLSTYGAVKVKNVDGKQGDVKTLQVQVNAENYKSILKILKDTLVENARGYDAKDDRLGGQPNQMNIQSMYSDIDLDANGMETEYQAAFEELLWFVNMHLANTGQGDFEGQEVKVVFNRDMLINTNELIQQCRDSEGQISRKTILAHHPWVDDIDGEIKQVDEEKQKEIDGYNEAFPQTADKGSDIDGEE